MFRYAAYAHLTLRKIEMKKDPRDTKNISEMNTDSKAFELLRRTKKYNFMTNLETK